MKRRLCLVAAMAILTGVSVLAGAQGISNVVAANHSNSSVDIVWTTDFSATSEVHYGLDANLGTVVTGDVGDVHRVSLPSLQASTSYFYQVVSDGEIDDNDGALYTFTTTSAGVGSLHLVAAILEDKLGQRIEGAWVVATIGASHPLAAVTNSSGVATLSLVNLKDSATGAAQAVDNGQVVDVTAFGPGNRVATVSHTLTEVNTAGALDIIAPNIVMNALPVAIAGATTLTEDNATSVSVAALDDDGDALTYSLFDDALGAVSSLTTAAGATVTLSGDIATYTPATDYAGLDSFDFFANDGTADGSVATVSVTVNGVNDAPLFNAVSAVTVDEDSASGSVAFSGIGPGGGADEASQIVTMTASSDNPTLVDIATVDGSGLTYTLTADANGAATITVTATDDGSGVSPDVNTASRTFTFTVTAVNDAPVFDAIGGFAVDEDSGSGSVTYTGVDPGGGTDEAAQAVTMTASSDNTAVVDITSFDNAGFVYTTLADANGSATITVTADDGQATDNTATRTLTITVNPLNDAPSFTTPADVTIAEDPGQQVVTISDFNPGGGADETSQTVTLDAVSSDPTIIPDPFVSGSGATRTLTYTPVADSNGGPVLITLTATDDGTAGAGEANTFSDIFQITVTATDDPPEFDSVANVFVDEDSGQGSISITNVGPGGGADEAGQTVTLTATSSDLAIVPNPSVTTSGATRTLTYAPEADAAGVATITLTADDGVNQVADTFTITVNAINDAPTFTAPTDATVSEDPGEQTLSIADVGPGGGADEASQTVTFTATSSDPSVVPTPTVSGTGATRTVTYEPAADANGVVTVTLTATDDGPAGSPHVESSTETFTITVDAVNDPPVYDAVLQQQVDEDTGATDITVTGVGPGGGADESSQTVTFTATSTDQTIVPDLSVSGSGDTRVLTFTPVADANGTVTITLIADDAQASNNTNGQAFTITVNAVNDEPTYDAVADVSVDEDAAESFITLTGIDPGGGPDESGQTVTFTAVSDKPSVVSNPTITGGVVSFTPVTDANGTAVITLTATDDGASSAPNDNTSVQTFTITVNAVNDAPAFDAIADVSIDEDAALTDVSITGLTAGGGADEATQTVVISTSSDNEAILPAPVVFDGGGTQTLSFSPQAEVNGTVVVTVTATDDGSGVTPNVNTYLQTFTITVNAVNDAPTFDAISDITVDEDFGSGSVTYSGIGAGGGADEAGQTVTMTVVNADPTVVEITSFDDAGFVYTTFPDVNGAASITVTATDDGDATAPSVNQFSRTLTITVNEINDAPEFDPIAGVTVDEDSDATSIVVTGVGPGGGDDETGQTVTLTASSSDPSVINDPAVNGSTLTFPPVANANGTVTITVTAADNGDGASPHVNTYSDTFTVVVNAINDPPVFDTIADIAVDEDFGSGSVPFAGVGPGGGSDESGQTVAMDVVSDTPTLVEITSFDDTGFTYATLADASGVATITVTATDDGDSASPSVNVSSQQFTITVNAVNDAPTFDAIADVTIDEDAAATTVQVTNIDPGGGADEASQTVVLSVASDDSSIISDVTVSGDLVTFTPLPDVNGVVDIIVTATDDGDSASPNVNASSYSFSVAVNAVNDAPVLDAIADIAADEDFGSDTVMFTGVGPGGGSDELAQAVTVGVVSGTPTLVEITSFDDTGFTYTTVADANGVATITVTATDDGDSVSPSVNESSQQFTITVEAVNDAPTFDAIADIAIDEDDPATTITVTNVDPGGGSDEASQTVTLSVQSLNTSLISDVGISGDSLTFTPEPDANGVVEITVTATDDGGAIAPNVNASSYTFEVTVNAANDRPTLDPIADVAVDEDSGPSDVALTGVTTGGGPDEAGQVIVVTAVSSHPSIVPDPTASGTTLTFQPEPDANIDTLGIGAVTITVTADDGQAENATTVETFDVVVVPINDLPTIDDLSATDLDMLANLVGVLEEGDPITVGLTGISYGRGVDEESQPITVSAEVTAEASLTGFPMFADVSVDPPNAVVGLTSATLSFTLGAFGGGDAVITVSVSDGLDITTLDVPIHVDPVNPPPDFAIRANGLTIIDLLPDATGSIDVDEDFGTLTFDITDIDPGDVPGEPAQTLTWAVGNSDPAIISVARLDSLNDPTTLTLTVAPDANTDAAGPVTISIAATDQSTAAGFTPLTTEKTLTVEVRAVNDPPVVSIVGVAGNVVEGGRNTPLTFQLAVTDVENDLTTAPVDVEVTGQTVGAFDFDAATFEVTYTPASDWTGQETLLVSAFDGDKTTEFTVTVNVTNDPPGAFADSVTVLETQTASVLFIASDPNGDTLTYSVTVAPTLGVLSGEGALLTYTPNRQPTAGFVDTDTLTFVAFDGIENSQPAQITITIVSENDAPTAFAVDPAGPIDAISGEPVTFALSAEDVDGDLVTFSATTTEGGGVAMADGIATYTATATVAVVEFITFTASDGVDQAASEIVVEVNVTPPNTEPVAGPQAPVAVVEGESIDLVLVGSDAELDPLTFTVVDAPTQGVLSGDAPNLTYTANRQPTDGFVGEDQFTYIVNDGKVDSVEAATVTVTIAEVNTAPTAFTVDPAGPLSVEMTDPATPITFSFVADDEDGDSVTFVLTTDPLTGDVVINGATATYTPAATETTVETIGFAAFDSVDQGEEIAVTVEIVVPNILPVATSQDVAVNEDEPLTITLSGVDPDGDDALLTYAVATQPALGELAVDGQNVTYTPFRQPTATFVDADEFTFTVNDGEADGDPATVSITITDVNDPPVMGAVDLGDVVEGETATATLTAVDIDGDPFSFVLVTEPTRGSVTIDASTATYVSARQPIAGFEGVDSFSIAAVDDAAARSEALVVTATITERNDPPTVSAEPATVPEDGVVVVPLTGQDPDGDPVTFLVSDAPAHGQVSLAGSLATYTPDPNYDQDDAFTVIGTDGRDEGDPATVTITVTPEDDPTELNPDRTLETVRVLEGADPLTIELGGNDPLFIDVDEGQEPIISATSSAASVVAADVTGSTLTLTFLAPGAATITVSAATATGAAQFTVEVQDNLPPVIEPLRKAQVVAGVSTEFQVVARDPEDDPLTYSIVSIGELTPPDGDPAPQFAIDPATGLLTVLVEAIARRTRNFTLTVSVSDGINDVEDPDLGLIGPTIGFVLQARRPNGPPRLTVQGAISAPLDELISFDVVAADDNVADTLTISASTRAVNADLDAAIRAFNTADEALDAGNFVKTFSFTATPDMAGQEFIVRWTVHDGELGAKADTVLVPGEITNLAPSIDVARLLDTAEEGQADDWILPVATTDPDGDDVFVEVAADNDQITYDDAAGEIRWSGIDFDSDGSYLVTVRARDREDPADPEVKTAEVTITLVVFDVNREPVFDSISPEVTVTREDVVQVEATASDPDGEAVTWGVKGLPSWARILTRTPGVNARLVVELAPTRLAQDAVFAITANDAAGTKVEQAVTVTLDDPPNRDPILEPLTSRNIEEGEALVVTVEASDPDGNELTFSADPLPDGAEFTNGVFTWTPSRGASENGDYDIVVTVDDGFGGVASDTLTVRVQSGKNRPPHLSQLPILEIEEESEGSIDLAAYSSDPDGDPTTVSLDTASLPGKLEMVDDVLTIRPVVGDAGTHPVHLRIADDRGKSTARTLRVDVTPLDGVVAEGLSVSGAFVDPGVGSPSDVFEFQATVTNTERRAPDPVVTLTLTLPDGGAREIEMAGGNGNLANGVTYSADATLSPGDYSFVVTASSDAVVVTANGVGPTVEAAEVVVSGVTVSGAAGTLRIAYLLENPNAGIGADVTVEYRVNGADWAVAAGVSGELAGLTTGQYEAAWDTLFDLPDANGDTVELRLTPTDGSETLADGFRLDNVLPAAPAVDEIAAFVAEPIVVVSGTSDSPGSTVVLRVDGIDTAQGNIQGDGSFRLQTRSFKDGPHTIRAFVREPAGDGPLSPRQVVVVDSAPPAVQITNPETGVEIATRSPAMTATIDAGFSRPNVTVGMRLNGRDVAAVFSAEDGEVTFTPTTPLVAGRVYLLSVTAVEPSGAETTVASVFTVDLTAADVTPPTGRARRPAPDDVIANASPTIEAGLSDSEAGIDPDGIELLLDDAPLTASFRRTDERNGVVVASVGAPLLDGPHVVAANFADLRGNPGTLTWTFTVDTTPPEAPVIVAPPLAIAVDELNVAGSAEPGATVSVVVDGAVRAVSDAGDTGDWTAALTLTDDGPHFIEAFAQDAVENTSALSETATVIVDRQGPRLSLITPTLGTASPQVEPLFEGVARDALSGIEPTSIALRLNGEPVAVAYDDSLGTFSYQTPAPFENGATVSVVIQAADLAGNPSVLEGEVVFDARLADVTPPVITAVTINGQDATTGGTTTIGEAEITVRLVVTDDLAGVESVVGVYDGQELAFTVEDRVATFFATPVEDGAHVLLVQATDILGNQSAIQQFDIVRKGAAAPPAFDPVDPITNVADVVLTGSGIDLGATVTVVVNGAPVETFVTDTTFATTLVTLREGENVVTATATDVVGNQAAADPLTISLDTTPPEAFFLDPAPNTTTAATQDVISVAFSDAVGVEPTSVTLDVDGAAVTPSVTTVGLTYQAPAPFSAGADGDVGNHHAVVTVQDIAGNQTTKLLNFSVDGTPPRIEGLVPNEGEDVTRIDPQVSATVVAQDVDPDSLEVLVGPVDGVLESVVGSADFAFTVTTGQINYFPALEDLTTYQVVVRVSDLVGNPAEASWTFTIDTSADDTTKPNVTVGFPQPGDAVNTAGLDILSFTTVDGSSGVDPNNVSLFLNDAQGDRPLILGQLEDEGLAAFNRETGEAKVYLRRILLIVMQGARGGFSFDPLELNSLERTLGGGGASFDPLELNSLERSIGEGDASSVASLERSLNTGANLLSTGTNEIGVQVTDLSGNVSFATWSFDVVLDPPQPPNFAALPASTNQSNFTVTGLVPNLAGALPVTVALRVNSSPVGVTEITELDGAFSIANVRLAEGDNVLTATAQDSTGNLSDRSDSFSIAVDLTPPTLRIDTAPGASAGDATRIAGRVSDDRREGVVELVLVVNGVDTALAVAPTFDTTVALPAEENTILVRATDAAGNVKSSDTYTVVVDRTPPTTAPTGLEAAPTADARGLIVSWRADPNATTYNVYRSGVEITDATDLTPVGLQVSGAFYTDTALPAGSTVYYAVTSVDAAGNEDPTVVSDALNVAWMRVQGGTASLADGTTFASPDRGLFTNVLRTAAVSFGVTPSDDAPSLDDAVDGTFREVAVRGATGTIDAFAQPATLTIPTTSASAVAHQLVEGEWIALDSTPTAGGVSARITSGGVYQLATSGVEGDVTGDDRVDIADLVTVARVFGQAVAPGDPADLNGDGVVNIADLVTVATHFGEGSASAVAAPSLVTGGASVRLSLSVNRLSADLGEVVVTAESPETIAGYEMRVSMTSPNVVMERAEPGDLLGSRVYWMPPKEDASGALLASVRLDLAEGVSGPSSGTVARFLVRSRGEVSAERLLDAVELRDVKFSDPSGSLLGSRVTRPRLVAPGVATALHANYPNPFNPETWIPYSLSEASEVTLRVYDARGGLVRTLELGRSDAGHHISRAESAYWDGRNDLGEPVAGGVYFVELQAGDTRTVRRLALSK